MNLSFDLDNIRFIEFGVGRDHAGDQTFDAVPTNVSVQSILRDMVKATAKQLEEQVVGIPKRCPDYRSGAPV